MKIYEYQAKKLFSQYGIPVEEHILCNRPNEIPIAFIKLGATKAVIKAQVLIGGRGKAGGIKLVNNAEELAAQYIRDSVTKPVVAFIAGQSAPPGKQMGHAGAIISGGSGSAAEKIAALQVAGIKIANEPSEIPALLKTGLHQKSTR